jgi:two-component system NtrC family sensor kinase
VTLGLDPSLPPIRGDSNRIFELAINLLRNAMQAMPGGGNISLTTRRVGEFVEARFSDAGHGVPDEIRERIFSPFFTTKAAGSGLGLTIVGQIVREHGGTIEVQSKVGSGTTFTVRLPLVGIEADHDETPDC